LIFAEGSFLKAEKILLEVPQLSDRVAERIEEHRKELEGVYRVRVEG